MDLKLYQMLEFINSRLTNMEKNLARMDEKLDFSITLQRNHLLRLKHQDELDDQMILLGSPYNDLSPEKAFKIYNNSEIDFLVVDVSLKSYHSHRVDGSLNIPLEELAIRYIEIPSRTTPLLLMSENGLRSIQACELLVKKGFFNVNNISGGHQYWPGHQKNSIPNKNI